MNSTHDTESLTCRNAAAYAAHKRDQLAESRVPMDAVLANFWNAASWMFAHEARELDASAIVTATRRRSHAKKTDD